MAYADGSVYDGLWRDDRYEGFGTLICPAYTYTGHWLHGEMHGWGECRMNNVCLGENVQKSVS